MKLDHLIRTGERIPPVNSGLRLAGVANGADIVNRDIIGGDMAGEVEELI